MPCRRRWAGLPLLLLGSLAAATAGLGQENKAAAPPIAPQQARLDQTINGLNGPGFAIAVNDAAGMVAAAGDGCIQLWHKDVLFGVRAGDGTGNVLDGHRGVVTALAWRGPLLASSAADKKILLWDAPSGQVLRAIDPGDVVRALALSPDGSLLASAGDLPAVELWQTADGKLLRKLEGHADWGLCVAFSPDGQQLASGGYDGDALLWDLASGNKVRELPTKPAPKPNETPQPRPVVTSVAFSPDGKFVAVGRADGTVDVVQADNGNRVRELKGHNSAVTHVAYHPAGELLVSSSKDGTLRLWNAGNGGLFKELTGHKAWVEGAAFLAQGTRLATVSADRTVRLWNLTNP